MTIENRPVIKNGCWRNGSVKKKLYDMPETLNILEAYGCAQKDLGQYLLDGELRAIGFPYENHEPDRVIEFQPSQFKREWKNASGFPIYDNHMGDMPRTEEVYTGEDPMEKLAVLRTAVQK